MSMAMNSHNCMNWEARVAISAVSFPRVVGPDQRQPAQKDASEEKIYDKVMRSLQKLERIFKMLTHRSIKKEMKMLEKHWTSLQEHYVNE